METGTDVELAVRGFLGREVMPPEEAEALAPDEDLLGRGVLNSLTLTHLAVFLEERYGMTIEPAEFELENFRTLSAIRAFVQGKRTD
jgi:acyl carrier protein